MKKEIKIDNLNIPELIAATEYFDKLAKEIRKRREDYMSTGIPVIIENYIKTDIDKVSDILRKHKSGKKIKIIKYRYFNDVQKIGEIKSLKAAREYQDYLKLALNLHQHFGIAYNKSMGKFNDLLNYYENKHTELKGVLESKFFNPEKMNRIKELYRITNKERISEIITSDLLEYNKVKEIYDILKKENPSKINAEIFEQVGEITGKDPDNVKEQYYQASRKLSSKNKR